MTNTVAGIGELLWDMLPGGPQPGGAPGNFACHTRAMGCDAVLVSRVGDDPEGRRLLDRVSEMGVPCGYVTVDPDHATGRSSVAVDAEGVPEFTVHENAAWDFIEFTPPLADLARRLDAVYFGTLPLRSPVSREAVERFLEATRPDAIRLFDANLRPPHYTREVVEASLDRANVLKLNDTELEVLSDYFALDGDPSTRLHGLLRRFGLLAVALTLGPNGSVLAAGDQTHVHPGCIVDVVDTVGAGDAFAAVLATGLLAGEPAESISGRANRAAAFVCSQPGATPVIPPRILASDQ